MILKTGIGLRQNTPCKDGDIRYKKVTGVESPFLAPFQERGIKVVFLKVKGDKEVGEYSFPSFCP